MLIAGLLALSATGSAQAGTVTVRFEHPEQFTDAGDRLGGGADDAVLRSLAQALEAAAQPCLGPAAELQVTVTEVDLAGRFEWWHRRAPFGLRVVRERDEPRIQLRARLSGAGAADFEREDTLFDRGGLASASRHDERLGTERAMLQRWARDHLCKP